MNSVNITGSGLVTALGASVDQTWRALMAGEFIRDHAPAVACVDRAPRVTSLAISAAREAIKSAGWRDPEIQSDQTALIVGTSKGPIERWMTAPPELPYRTNHVGSMSMGLHEIAESLAGEFHFAHGPRLTLSSACSSGLHALIHAAMLIHAGRIQRALVVAAEAALHPLFVGSFKRLGVLPPEGHGCRPFDVDRQGFLMSEAAAAVCLEAGESACGLASVERFALGADATHLTGVDPAGATLKRLLADVIDGRPVDLIHAHGTGTEMNDPVELAAIEHAVSESTELPWLYSHKGALGHSLGAAGLVSIILNTRAMRMGEIPPNVQSSRPLAMQRVKLNPEPQKSRIRRSIAIAAGFGGPIAVVSFKNG